MGDLFEVFRADPGRGEEEADSLPLADMTKLQDLENWMTTKSNLAVARRHQLINAEHN
jgi:hypothetical protein